MGESLRLAVGIMGNAASILLYSVPILTFARIIKKGSTQGFSCVPYVLALLNCLLFTWYGLPVVSRGWENFLVVSTNGVGIVLEFSFIVVYFWFVSAKGKAKVAAMVIPVMVVFCATALVSAFVFHDHHHRKLFVGSVGLMASVSMYGSPLVVVKLVIQTKSVEFMPFYLSFFSFLASSLWTAYGLLSRDLFIMSPSLVGSALGIFQLVVYFKYRKHEVMQEPRDWDIESVETKITKTEEGIKANGGVEGAKN